jgi:site-specific recombinase XerD
LAIYEGLRERAEVIDRLPGRRREAARVRDARLHDARHTTATTLLILGVPSRAVMDVMGWSNVALTTRYQHITTELTASIANQIGDLLWTDQGKTDDEDDGEAPVPAAV